MNEIQITCKGAKSVPLNKLVEIQGNLKSLSYEMNAIRHGNGEYYRRDYCRYVIDGKAEEIKKKHR